MPVIITKNKNETNNGPMDVLPTTKVKNGFLYKLLKRNSQAAMYSQEFDEIEEGRKTGIIGYEVFKVIVGGPSCIQQKSGVKAGMWYQYPSTEKFPGNNDFGNTAWSYITIESAEKKFKELSK